MNLFRLVCCKYIAIYKVICNTIISYIIMAVTKTRTGLGLDWDWTGAGLEHFSL